VYQYHRTEPGLWTVYDTDVENTVSDHGSEAEARDEAIRLNGGTPASDIDDHDERIEALEEEVKALRLRLDVVIQANDKFEKWFEILSARIDEMPSAV
jgi:hypothetical protein